MSNPGLVPGLVFFGLLAILGRLLLAASRQHYRTPQLEVRLFLCAFAVRFAMSVVIYQFGLVEVLKDEDASGWLVGAAFHRAWVQNEVGLLDLPVVLAEAFNVGTGSHRGYYYMTGALFYLTDAPYRLVAAALNGFFGAFIVVFVYRTASLLFSHWVAVRVGWWTCLFPAMIIWSAQTLKEPVIICLETLALYGCVQLKRLGFTPRYVLLCALTVVLLIPFRFYASSITAVAVVLALASPQLSRRRLTTGAALGVAGCLVAAFVVMGLLAQQAALVERFDLEYIHNLRTYGAATTGSGVMTSYDLQTPSGFVLATLVGAAHLLLAPFPWQYTDGSLRMVLTLPEVVVWWWLVFAGLLPGLRYAIRQRFGDIQPLLLFIIGLGLLYSITFSNVGTVYRQRAQLLPWLLIIAVVGLEQRLQLRSAAHQAWARRRELTRSRQGWGYG